MSEDNPCIGICEIEDGYCIGCGRSAEVIFGETDSAGSDASEVGVDRLHPMPGEPIESSD